MKSTRKDLGHEANEWADMATNGLQWLRNIRDGVSTPVEAIAEMESNLARIRALTAPRPSAAAWAALAAMQQGREFRSGPHLAVLAEHGFIERTGSNGRYEPTQLGIRELGFEQMRSKAIMDGLDMCAGDER